MVVSRWRQKCYEEEKYQAIIESNYLKMAKDIECRFHNSSLSYAHPSRQKSISKDAAYSRFAIFLKNPPITEPNEVATTHRPIANGYTLIKPVISRDHK